MNATNKPNTATRFLEITDSFPIPGSDTLNLMHEACQPEQAFAQHL